MAEQHDSENKVLVILGHPQSDSLCASMARAYADGARQAGAQVRCLNVGQLAFNATLADGRGVNVLATLPEPGAAGVLLLGLGAATLRRRR